METWKEIKGYENLYEVSNEGRVRTTKEKVTHTSLHGTRHWKQRIMKQKTDRYGYKRVTLWKDGKPKDFLVHRLVATVFLDRPDGKDLINHKDCDPGNNNIDNIEWCDYAENLLHAYKNGLNNSCKSVILVDKQTSEHHEFLSMAKASVFMNKNKRYVSGLLKRGISETNDYEIYLTK